MPSSKHLAQSAHDELFKFFVSGGAGKALYSGAGHDVFGLCAVYAAAFKIEKRGVVQLADGRAVVAGSLLTVMFSIVCSLPLSRCYLSFQGG